VRVLIYSPAFFPSVGGLEEVVGLLAAELHRAGDTVCVVSTTPYDRPEPFPFAVVRRPGPLELLRRVHACDVLFQANVSLKGLWPLLLVRRPYVVSHHSWYRQPDGGLSWRDRLKRAVHRRATASIAVSRAMADDLGPPATVIENPYRDDLFTADSTVPRDGELLFVGRLVSDKGCDLLLDALGILQDRGTAPALTVVGSGPEAQPLARRAAALGLTKQVRFTGRCTGEELRTLFRRHRWLVVPSRYNEPFGVVALEGLACGCAVIGSAGGGLVEAIGPGGWTFPNGDTAALADLIERVAGGELPTPDRDAVARHLARHTSRRVGDAYRTVLAAAAHRTTEPNRPDRQ